MFKHCTRAPLHSFSARSFFSLLLSGSFFVDRVSRDENRIAVCGSNKNRRVVKCQPQSAATRVTRQGKHESKKEKKASLQPRLSSIVDNFFRGREGKFSRLTLSIFLTRSLISRRDSREFPLEFGKTRRPGTNSDCIGIRNEETKVKP